jgi:hypothetical protein
MSEFIEYDMSKLSITRAQKVAATLGNFILGESLLGPTDLVSGQAPIEFVSFSYNASYQVNQYRVLIIDTISGTLTVSYWGDPTDSPELLRPSDILNIRYYDPDNGMDWKWTAVVETISPVTYFDHAARAKGAPGSVRTDLNVSLIDKNIASMRAQLCYGQLPPENSITRIRRWITVDEWSAGVS